MATPTDKVRLAGGTLIANPTNLGIASPYGGTVLGTAVNVKIVHTVNTDEITAHEYGSEPVDEIYLHTRWVVSFLLTNWDADALALIFPNVVAGVGAVPVVSDPGLFAAGSVLSSRGVKLLLAPNDIDEDPGFLMYRGLPRADGTQELEFDGREGLSLLATFVGIRDVNNRTVAIAKLAELTL